MAELHPWILAIRPKTLWAAVGPVMIGTAIAFEAGRGDGPSAGAALLGAVLIQIGTNLANDYFDYKKGADTWDRIGPIRATQAGLIRMETMKKGIATAFLLAAAAGLYLIWRGGWPILWIGLFSIASGIAYTAGPCPLAYLGLGDLFVLLFFGPIAVGGTYYVQALEIDTTVLFIGLAPGLLSVAILTVNNLRDIETDRRAGKRTLAVRFGPCFAKFEYLAAVLLAILIPLAVFLDSKEHPYSLLTLAVGFIAIPAFRTLFSKEDPSSLNRLLDSTAKLLLLYSLLFSIGWIL